MPTLSSTQSVLPVYLHILSMFQHLRLSVYWLRVMLAVIMVPFALLGVAGDQLYLKGLKERNILPFELAAFVFPFDKDILIGPSEFRITNKILDENTYRTLKEQIKYDPNSPRLLGMYMQYAAYFGNINDAQMSFKKLEIIAPNSNVLKAVKKINIKGYLK